VRKEQRARKHRRRSHFSMISLLNTGKPVVFLPEPHAGHNWSQKKGDVTVYIYIYNTCLWGRGRAAGSYRSSVFEFFLRVLLW
jgi:hypothetical protein